MDSAQQPAQPSVSAQAPHLDAGRGTKATDSRPRHLGLQCLGRTMENVFKGGGDRGEEGEFPS